MSEGKPTLGRPHVFLVLGDVTRIECDAWLLPTDRGFNITRSFREVVGLNPSDDGRLSGYEWGDAAVVRWNRPPEDHGPQIWLGDVGRLVGEWSEDLARVAAEFVEKASRAVGSKTATGRYPVLALPVIGTGHGGASSHKGEVYLALFEALTDASLAHGADVVLVLKTTRGYSAAQRARTHLLAQRFGDERATLWDFGVAERAGQFIGVAERLAKVLRQGRLVQFVGAGASGGLSRRAGIPAWQALLDAVATEVGEPALDLRGLDPVDQATVLERRLEATGKSLSELLARRVTRSHYTLAHGLLASLGSSQHVTTNFDTMLENALRAVDENLAVLPYAAVEREERWVLKLHGSVDRWSEGGTEGFIITRDDYLSMPGRYGALYGLVQALLLTQHMLFVGYSLRDEDFHRLVYEVKAARRQQTPKIKMGTVLTLFETPAFDVLWPDLDVVAMVDSPAPEDGNEPTVTVAARRLLLFLDLLGHEAASLYRFLLDPNYDALLPDADDREPNALADVRLRSALVALAQAADGQSTVGWQPVHRLLAEYGAEPRTGAAISD